MLVRACVKGMMMLEENLSLIHICIYVYQEGSQDYAVNFAQLTQRAGNFLVGRQPEDNFKWESLKGKKVLGGRAGGMPQMVFEYILKKHGMDPKTDLSIDQSINFGLTAAAFTSDDADYTVEFEPFATTLESEGSGYVVASLGTESGYVPYTAYCARKSYVEQNPEIIQKFTNAIQKGKMCIRDSDMAIHHRPHILTRLNLVQMGHKAEGRITWLALDMSDNISAVSSICFPGFIYGSLYSSLLKIVHKPPALLHLPAGRTVNLNQFQKTFLHPFA